MGVSLNAGAENKSHIVDSLRNCLRTASGSTDSLRILYDIYDIKFSNREDKTEGWEILDLARRTGNNSATYDIIRRLSVKYLKNDSVLNELDHIVRSMPDSRDHRGTAVFISTQKTVGMLRYSSDAKIDSLLCHALANDTGTVSGDLYSEIDRLYKICLYLSSETQGGMYLSYLERLGSLIERLPKESNPLKSQYYTTTANIYSLNAMHEKAVSADKKLLTIIEGLEKQFAAQGRRYRNYDINKYVCYRRMLGNYKALTPGEVEHCYDEILHLERVNSKIAQDLEANPRATAFYYMATRQYDQAIPLILKQLDNLDDMHVRRQLLGMLAEAAEVNGDQATLVKALKEYSRSLEEYIRSRSEQAYRELQLRYDVDELKSKNAGLAIMQKESKIVTRNKVISVALIGVLVLAVLLFILHRFYLREKNLNVRLTREKSSLDNRLKSMKRINDELEKERPSDRNPGTPSR